jgi:short-subunit dehydrogenase
MTTSPLPTTPTPTTAHPLAMITGASSGIGAQFARRYAREGFDLVLVARSEAALHELAAELVDEHGVGVDVHVADLATPAGVDALVQRIAADARAVDHLVNSAGIAPEGDLADADGGSLRHMVDLNITALTLLNRAAIVRMRAAGTGTIINVASGSAYQPVPHMAAYSASKSYVLMLSEAMYEENRGHGLRVLAISPGATETPMNPGSAGGKRTPEQVVDTAWRALRGNRPSVIDGTANSVLAAIASRVLPTRAALRIAERMMRAKM